MRLAVVQHARRPTVVQDEADLLEALIEACSRGAETVVLPYPSWMPATGIAAVARAALIGDRYPGVTVLAGPFEPWDTAAASTTASDSLVHGARLTSTPLGTTAALTGDECLDPLVAEGLAVATPNAIVLRPGSESELQAEAMLERALGLSESASGLVVIAEADGSADGEPGHGGSAIAVLGEMLAEAMGGDDILIAEFAVPVPRPEVRPPVPELPPILAQRWALHHGRRVSVDYPADPT